jgi:hypothetical protein
MKTLRFFIPTLLFLFVYSCSKDVRHTNKIHGVWNIERISAVSSDGNTTFTTIPEGFFQFNKCDIHQDDYRAYKEEYTYQAGSTTVTSSGKGIYRFFDDGDRLVIRSENGGGYHQTTYHVTSFSKKKIAMEIRHSDNSKTVFELER